MNEDDAELLDQLPMHLRNKVLEEMEVDEGLTASAMPEMPGTRQRVWHLVLLWPWLFMFAIPFVVLGILLMLTFILAPVGIGIAWAGVAPLAWCSSIILQRLRGGSQN